MAKEIKQLRVMIDANILVAGSSYPRFFYEVLEHSLHKDFQLLLSPTIINEAKYSTQKRFPHRLKYLSAFLERDHYELVPDPPQKEIDRNLDLIPQDKKDVPIALSAIKAKVDCLVTNDNHFFAAPKFQEKVTPIIAGRFLKEAMNWTSEELEAIRYRTWSDLKSTL